MQLIATLEDNVSYVVAWSETQPFTLRNRSPGNYYEDRTLIPRAKKALYAKTYGEDGEEEVKNENPDENNPKKLNDLLMKHALALSHSFMKDYGNWKKTLTLIWTATTQTVIAIPVASLKNTPN